MEEEEKIENVEINTGSQIGDTFYKTFFDVSKFFNSSEKMEKIKIYNEKYNQYIIENKKNISMEILKNFVPHFSCFNLGSSDIIEIINDTSVQYCFNEEKEKLKFFMTVINSNFYSIKNIRFKFQNLNSNSIKKDDFYSNHFLNKNYLSKPRNRENKILIILNSSDYVNLMCLDKKLNKIITRVIYKNLLLNLNESISKKVKIANIQNNKEIRIKIWQKLLNYKTLNYKEIKLFVSFLILLFHKLTKFHFLVHKII